MVFLIMLKVKQLEIMNKQELLKTYPELVKKHNIIPFSSLHNELRSDLDKTGVYLIYHTCKPGIYYIGSAATHVAATYKDKGFLQRWRNHFSTIKRGIHFNAYLQRVVSKYGLEGLRFKILEKCEPNACINTELKWLTFYVKNYSVYNMQQVHPTRLNCKLSDETKYKIGNKRNKKKVYQFDLNGNLIKTYDCFYHTLLDFPKGQGCIWSALTCKRATAYKFIWSYSSKFIHKNFNRSKPVTQMDLTGNIIGNFLSAKIAYDKTGVPKSDISKCCCGIRLTAGGFTWKFKKLNSNGSNT